MEFLGKNKKRGRPAFKPTKPMRNQVEIGTAVGLPHTQIAAVLGISRQTLENNFIDELKNGRARKLVQSLCLLDRAAKRGSVAAAKFLVNAFNNGASLQRIGKKQRATLAAKSAAVGTEWEGLIAYPTVHDDQTDTDAVNGQ